MLRRDFILTTVSAAATTLVGAVTERWLPDDADAQEDRNREAFRQRLRRLCEEGFEIEWLCLSPIWNGQRFVEVFHRRGVETFWIEWQS
jgi:hypothetical protein